MEKVKQAAVYTLTINHGETSYIYVGSTKDIRARMTVHLRELEKGSVIITSNMIDSRSFCYKVQRCYTKDESVKLLTDKIQTLKNSIESNLTDYQKKISTLSEDLSSIKRTFRKMSIWQFLRWRKSEKN